MISLRGSETTEAISQLAKDKEIAALPSVARNDRQRLRHSLFKEEVGMKGTPPAEA
jgi:hypothetical protein